ncbi:hypothetical protein GF406_25850 [candidate division KSB1 bacterium]|nr:hypothetical protein [candidate division KSB1 bacterium]
MLIFFILSIIAFIIYILFSYWYLDIIYSDLMRNPNLDYKEADFSDHQSAWEMNRPPIIRNNLLLSRIVYGHFLFYWAGILCLIILLIYNRSIGSILFIAIISYPIFRLSYRTIYRLVESHNINEISKLKKDENLNEEAWSIRKKQILDELDEGLRKNGLIDTNDNDN